MLFSRPRPRETPVPPSFRMPPRLGYQTAQSLPSGYSLKTASLPQYCKALQKGDVPEVFDAAFLTALGFRFAIDRSFIEILKDLRFLDSRGRPTARYRDYRNPAMAQKALGEGIREAYAELFKAHPDAATMTDQEVIDALKPLYAGTKPDMMVCGIARTFVALCRIAATPKTGAKTGTIRNQGPGSTPPSAPTTPAAKPKLPPSGASGSPEARPATPANRLILSPKANPATIHDAIFESLRRTLPAIANEEGMPPAAGRNDGPSRTLPNRECGDAGRWPAAAS